jgi:CRISPR/Cas system-associated exonuclease Cas4 (RecB family)
VSSACAGLTSIFEPEKVNVVGTELRLDGIEVGGTPMKGFIDLLTTDIDKTLDEGKTLDTEKLPDDTPLIIWDYKTGKYQDATSRFGDKCEHDMQQRLYFAALKAKGKNPVEANLAYTKDGRVRKVDTSEEAVEQEVEQFRQNWKTLNQTIKSNVYPTKASVLCGWCPYVKACPKAQASPKILYSRHSVSEGDATGKAYSRNELF